MGLSIHYRGRLDNVNQLLALRDELMDIASRNGWQYGTLDEDWHVPADAILTHRGKTAEITGHLGLKGIQLKPTGQSEPLQFFFDSEGNLRSPVNVVLIQSGMLTLDDAWISVKTQFLSAQTHVVIIRMLKYMKRRHLSNLEVIDEGRYWETGDDRILKEKMRLINEKLDFVSRELSSERFGDARRLSVDEIAARIERLFHSDEPYV
jgi:hypothetical protein